MGKPLIRVTHPTLGHKPPENGISQILFSKGVFLELRKIDADSDDDADTILSARQDKPLGERYLRGSH